MLAMLNPIGVVASAIFVAGIFVGADAMSRSAGVPSYIADVMVATALLLTMVVAILVHPLQAEVEDDGSARHPPHRLLLGRRDPHRLAADLRHHGRADLRARRRSEPRHRRHHDGRRLRRLVHRLCRRRSLDRRPGRRTRRRHVRPAPRDAHRAARPVAACGRHRRHAACHQPHLFHLPAGAARGHLAAQDRAVPAAADPRPVEHSGRRPKRCSRRRRSPISPSSPSR